MNLTFSHDENLKRLVIDATPNEYDGVPLTTRVWFSGIPALPPQEFLPIIGALCFRSFIGISFGCESGVPVFLIDPVHELMPRPGVQITTLDLTPSPLYEGFRSMRVCDLRLIEDHQLVGDSGIDLIIDATGSFGGFQGGTLSVVATNAFLNLPDRVEPQIDCLCASALAAASFCGANHIVLPMMRSHRLQAAQVDRLTRALQHVGIRLEFKDCGTDTEAVVRNLIAQIGLEGPPEAAPKSGAAGSAEIGSGNVPEGEIYTLRAQVLAAALPDR